MFLTLLEMLLELELHKRHLTIWTILLQQLDLLLLLQLIQHPLTLLTIRQVPLEHINIEYAHTYRTLLKHLLVVLRLWEGLFAGDAVCVGFEVLHGAEGTEDAEFHGDEVG